MGRLPGVGRGADMFVDVPVTCHKVTAVGDVDRGHTTRQTV